MEGRAGRDSTSGWTGGRAWQAGVEVGRWALSFQIYTEREVRRMSVSEWRVIDEGYTRHLAIVGRKGHVATFDWQTGTMHAELQLRETCRDVTSVRTYFETDYRLTQCADSYMTIHISR